MPRISKEYTFKMMNDFEYPVQARDIAEKYIELNIATTMRKDIARTVLRHFEYLESLNLIYRTNPDAKRCRRYHITMRRK